MKDFYLTLKITERLAKKQPPKGCAVKIKGGD